MREVTKALLARHQLKIDKVLSDIKDYKKDRLEALDRIKDPVLKAWANR